MKIKKEDLSKNVELDSSMYRNPSNGRMKESRKDRQMSTEGAKVNRQDRIYNSPEFKKALNDIAVDYNKKIGSGKGNRIVKK